MDTTLDKQVSERIRSLMEKYKIKGKIIANLIDVSPSSASDMILGKSPWRIAYLVDIAIYFKLTLEELVLNDAQFTKKKIKEYDKSRKKYLIDYFKNEPTDEEFKKMVFRELKFENNRTNMRKIISKK